ncbi:uncharacterized protein PFL1_02826 [Pseudozyma flocculosa PF-1]|uniref:Regulatory P domain-containing protein n=2 Tax=Pseudozyma flocculosa TaxID=84751 RepID=A0A5C3F2D7_9BASI|nr:uncharacterized protein PFL1_02826 [Pseudozyma flocculosa PF-1]EPQ29607.1 hypothetical protein PFL1_02826 [Pseudozyma flocculosa PF-1]SPO38165.1 uncharacterized protein PSFLO_03642 [Pseudozyma flocculosa]
MKGFKLSALLVASALALFSATSDVAAAPGQLTTRQSLMQVEGLMAHKEASRQRCREQGLCGKYNPDANARRVAPRAATCVNGKAGEYPCRNVNMLDMLSHTEMGSKTAEGNDCWGWTSGGREFGLVGQTDGTAFVEINASTGAMKYLGRLPTQTVNSIWRDIKVIGNYAYIGAEASGHGLQIFDLRKLLTVTTPQTFTAGAVFKGFGSSHNIVNSANPNVIIAVGQTTCSGGPHFVDVSNPLSPKDLGCYGGDGYTHDAQCVTYNGPDTAYKGKEVCFAYNEDTLTILDVSDKRNVKLISRTPYRGSAYTHQGWLTDASQTYLLLDDELDEEKATVSAADGHTRTYLWNIKNLSKPVLEGAYRSPVTSIDHNQYVVNGYSYQANYASGLRIVDVRNVANGGGLASMKEAGFFDVRPEDDVVDFYGSWNAYPFPSGKVLVNSIERGAYVVKPTFN